MFKTDLCFMNGYTLQFVLNVLGAVRVPGRVWRLGQRQAVAFR